MTSIDETCGDAPIRIAIADDQDLVRKGFRLILSSFPGIEVVGEAVDGADAVALARRMRPDVLLMDIRMPRKDGIEACRELAGDPIRPMSRCLFLRRSTSTNTSTMRLRGCERLLAERRRSRRFGPGHSRCA